MKANKTSSALASLPSPPYPMATHLNEPLVVEKKEIIIVKPSQPTPSDLLSLSTIDNDPNLEVLCQVIHVYRSLNGCDPNQLDPAPAIQQGLSEALVHYYPLAGKLKRHEDGKLRANCTEEGVPFCSATANCTLSSLNYLNDISVDTSKLFILEFESPSELGLHPLVVQITQFACGGFTVGMGLSHSICDGFGAAQFFKAMAEFTSGAHELSVNPVWERERLVSSPFHEYSTILFPADKASFAASPYLPSTDLVHESFSFTAKSIRRLKARLEKENEGVTTLEALGAYVWRSKFKALEMNLDGKTNFLLSVGIRKILDPPLPEGYYGNAFVASHVALQGKELCEWPLSKVAWVIKVSKRRATRTGYVKDYLGILEEINRENRRFEASGSTTFVTDWRHVGLMDVDFGSERQVNILPMPWNMLGSVNICIILPPFDLDPVMKGGVRVFVCLPRAAMGKFKEEMASLSNEGLSE